MEIKWLSRDQLEGFAEKFAEKQRASIEDKYIFNAKEDAIIFYKGIIDGLKLSKISEVHEDPARHDESYVFYKGVREFIDEFGDVAIAIEIRGHDIHCILKINKEDELFGSFTGKYEPLDDIKNNLWIEFTSKNQEKMMELDMEKDFVWSNEDNAYRVNGEILTEEMLDNEDIDADDLLYFFDFLIWEFENFMNEYGL
ncbi:MAG: hypothetical protein EU551_00395 [Promethearchaeota archaeon]|nr:MAG: hypothetical protein EU551_00395 [Candidatus Lokiarchaeota archaeon]